jgi:cytoskeleton protein RodZ
METRLDTGLGLGDRLRSARRARAMSIDQAARALHLEEAILQALEDERFAELGAPVFVRGHLRSYARLLGLAEDGVLEAYRLADPASEALPRVARDLEKPLAASPGPYAVAIGVGVFLLALVAWFVGSQGGPAAPPAGPVALPAGEPLPDQPETEPPGSAAEPVVATPGLIRVELDFTQASPVQIDAAGGRAADGDQPAGTSLVLELSPPVDIVLGNAPGVRVRVNGADYALPPGALTPGTTVARFRIDALPLAAVLPGAATAGPGGGVAGAAAPPVTETPVPAP